MWHNRAVLLAAATCLVALLPVPVATAEELVRHDARHDVWWDDELVARRAAHPDIARIKVAHRERALVVRVGFAVLKARPRQGLFVRVWTPDDGDSRRQYRIWVSRTRAHGSTSFAIDSSCEGMKARIGLRRDFMRLRVPRACLGTPDWVRVAISSYRTPPGWRGALDDVSDDGFTELSTFLSQGRSRRLFSG
jgi:hypothetical protein